MAGAMFFNWWFIVILIFLVLIVLKIKYLKHKFFMILLLIAVLFFYTTSSVLIAKENLDITTFDGVVQLGRAYMAWFGNAFSNFRQITTAAIKMDWYTNSTGG